MPGDATEVLENFEYGVSLGEVFVNHVRAVDVQRRLAFAQHKQSCRVVNLGVHENDGLDCRVADCTRGLQFGEILKLRQNVWRRIEE